MERRYHSPYRFWVSGFLFEVGLFLAFLVVLGIVASVVMRLAG